MIETTPKLYRCDPEKNRECTKEACRLYCRMTTRKECSTDGHELTYAERIEEQRIADDLFREMEREGKI